MPTYQYACTECGAQMEVVQSFSDDALTVCPECEGRLRKVYSAVGIVFKGSGFYRTDSGKSSNSSVLTGSGSGSGESKDGGNSGSTDSSSTSSDAKGSSSDTGSGTTTSKAGSTSAAAATG
ncbi:FmdB family transcriptional regulator [Glycomyces fuscus]|nr:FmdB family transcriptional regulator [Glycomyces fuscus]